MAKKKYIESPETLWQLFQEYRKEVKESPYLIHDVRGKDLEDVHIHTEQPLIMEGFETFLSDKGILQDLKDYASNKDERYSDYAPIITRIRTTIKADQLKLGLLNIINPNLTARINGISEKREDTIKVEQPLFPDVSEDDRS